MGPENRIRVQGEDEGKRVHLRPQFRKNEKRLPVPSRPQKKEGVTIQKETKRNSRRFSFSLESTRRRERRQVSRHHRAKEKRREGPLPRCQSHGPEKRKKITQESESGDMATLSIRVEKGRNEGTREKVRLSTKPTRKPLTFSRNGTNSKSERGRMTPPAGPFGCLALKGKKKGVYFASAASRKERKEKETPIPPGRPWKKERSLLRKRRIKERKHT